MHDDPMQPDPAGDGVDPDLGFALPSLPSLGESLTPATRASSGGLSLPPIRPDTIDDAMRHDAPDTVTDPAGRGDQPPTAASTLLIDPRYGSARVLAQGGMGMVLTATDSRLNREVAMKLIRRDRLNDPQARARFLREAQVHAQLEHPNIVPVHDLVESDGSATYFTMKLVRGRSLAELIRDLRDDMARGRGDAAFRLGDRLDVFRKVCDGVAFSHSRGVIHRDLKPDNVMVGQFGEVQIMDWGLARVTGQPDLAAPQAPAASHSPGTSPISPARAGGAIAPARPATMPATVPPPPARHQPASRLRRGGTSRPDTGRKAPAASAASSDTGHVQLRDNASDALSVAGSVMGTPQYMAPEQASGNELDERCDIYALGAILYELLTLRPAIDPGPMFGVLHRVIKGDFPPPSRRVASESGPGALRGLSVPPELEAVVMKAMANRPARRYHTAVELRLDVGDFLDGRIVGAARYTIWQRTRRFIRRNRVAMGVAALVIVMAAGGILAAVIAAAQARNAVLNQLRAGLDAATDATGTLAASLEAGHWQHVVDGFEQFRSDHVPRLAAIANNDVVQSGHPEWLDEAETVRANALQLRDDALMRWAGAELDALPPPDGDASSTAEASFMRFQPWLAKVPALPVADFAFWLARSAAAAADHELEVLERTPTSAQRERFRDAEAKMVIWVSRGWMAQPDAEATGRAFLLIANRELQRLTSATHLESVILRLHRAWSIFGKKSPSLRPRVLLSLAIALVGMEVKAATPFARDVPAHRMALRCLLQLLEPDGAVRPQAATWMADWPESERDHLLEVARQCLLIARRTAGDGSPKGFTQWPLDEHLGYSLAERDLELASFEPPAAAGFAPPDVRIQSRIPYTRMFNLAGTIVMRSVLLHRGPDGRVGIAAWLMLNGESGIGWLPDVSRPGVGATWKPFDADRRLYRWGLGDVNGDNRVDIVGAARFDPAWESSSDVEVMLQRPDGSFGDPIPIRTPDLLQPQMRSEVLCLSVADLDADGTCEVVVSRTRFNHYSTTLYSFDARGNARQLDRKITGEAVMVPVPGGAEPLLMLDGFVNDSQRRQYDAIGEPTAYGYHLYRMRNGRFDEQPLPWTSVGSFYRMVEGQSISTPHDLHEADAHVIHHPGGAVPPTGGLWPCNRWLLWRGADLAQPIAAREWRVGTVFLPITDVVGWTDAGLVRRLRDQDLQPLMEPGVPVPESDDPRGEPAATLAKMLMAFANPAAAAQVARERLAAGEIEPAVELELNGLLLRAMRADGDLAGVTAFLRQLPIMSAHVPLMLEGTNALLREAGQWEAVIELLQPWEQNRWLTDQEHARIAESLMPLVDAATQLAGRGVEVRGEQLWVNGKPAGTIANAMMTSDIRQLRQHPGSTTGPWHCVCSGPRWIGAGESCLLDRIPRVLDHPDVAGAARVDGRELVMSGIPVRVEPGSAWRMTVVFEIPGGFWDSWVRFGLMEAGPDGVTGGVGMNFQMAGELRNNRLYMYWPGLPPLDSLFGRRLRLDMEDIPGIGLRRVTLTDNATGDIVGAYAASVGRNYPSMPALGSPWRVLGTFASGTWRGELTIHSMQLRGNVQLWPVVEPERSAFPVGADGDAAWRTAHDLWRAGKSHLPASLTMRTMTAAARAHAAGRRDEAATILQQLATRLLQAPAGTPEQQAEVAEMANACLLDAAWELGWRDANAFSAQLTPLLASARSQGPQALEGVVQQLERWLLAHGHWPPEPGLWEGAGGALMNTLLDPGQDAASAIANRINATGLDYTQCRNLAMAAWLAFRVPEQKPFLESALHAISAASIDNPFLQPVRLWFLHATRRAAGQPALNEELRQTRLAILFEFHRRAEALALSRAGDDAWTRERFVVPLVTHQRRVHETRQDSVTGEMARIARQAVRRPE